MSEEFTIVKRERRRAKPSPAKIAFNENANRHTLVLAVMIDKTRPIHRSMFIHLHDNNKPDDTYPYIWDQWGHEICDYQHIEWNRDINITIEKCGKFADMINYSRKLIVTCVSVESGRWWMLRQGETAY